jgi:hypothetical protein
MPVADGVALLDRMIEEWKSRLFCCSGGFTGHGVKTNTPITRAYRYGTYKPYGTSAPKGVLYIGIIPG